MQIDRNIPIIHQAFTIIEVIFVLVVIGIIAMVLIPRFDDSAGRREAALQLISDIRYTQHLAMNDDHISKTEPNWYKKRWTILFNSDNYTDNEEAYTIFADTGGNSTGKPDESEIAINPLDPSRLLSGGFSGKTHLDIRKLKTDPSSFVGTKRNNLGKTYGIKKVVLSRECKLGTSKRIAFDHVGRPLKGSLSSYTSPYPSVNKIITKRCKITLTDKNDKNISIYIEPETGYAHL